MLDVLLSSYLQAGEETVSHRILAELVSEHAAPLVRKIVRHKLHAPSHNAPNNQLNEDAEDVCGEAVLRLVARLRELKERAADERPINDFRGYVATVAYHHCHEYLRRKYPRRHGLKNKLRYLLSRDARFAIWEGGDRQLLCGFEAWRATQPLSARVEPARLGVGESGESLDFGDAGQVALPDLLKAVFERTGGPVELDALVDFVAALTGVRDEPEQAKREGAEAESEVADARAPPSGDVAAAAERQMYLARLWEEIKALPPRQRTALLLNLSDAHGRSYTELLALLGVASARQIADALEIPADEFAIIWNDLPLDDRVIAARLNLSRQQVINLRKSARERLARRMQASGL
ncbi:MAG: sigma-70 family RNA polymerase sigma factor [Pyrinomonadaceae bacterium]